MKALRRMNEALPGLVGGILGYGLVVFGVGILFVPDRKQFVVGLAVGLGCAVFMAVHIASVLNASVAFGESSVRLLAAKSVMRYLVVVAVFFGMTYFHLGDFIAAFVGIMGLKVSAYIQQFKRRR